MASPGPALSPTAEQLDRSLVCSGKLEGTTKEPVLLIPATTYTARSNFHWNWMPALTSLGIPWCGVTPPEGNMGDIQVAGEYVVHAIRAMHAQAKRPIALFGHSQGAVLSRWPLRFWPDTREMVADVISAGGSNHGTALFDPLCAAGCAPAVWQQRSKSAYLDALNLPAETYAGISYTQIRTSTDEVVIPSTSSFLTTGRGRISNATVQDTCPLQPADHFTIGTTNPVAFALTIDAITHDGPGNPARLAPETCNTPMPGIDENTLTTDSLGFVLNPVGPLALYPHVPEEPRLACYVTNTCAEGPAPQPATSCAAGATRTVRLAAARGSRVVRITANGARLGYSARRQGRRILLRIKVSGQRPGNVRIAVRVRSKSGKTRTVRRTVLAC